MNSYANPYTVAQAEPSVRAEFIKKTYIHLAIAIGAFALLASVLLQIPGVVAFAGLMTKGYMWLVVIGAFVAVSWMADKWAHSGASVGKQYAGLGLYVVAQAVIFIPILVVATKFVPAESHVLAKAGIVTGLMVAGITAVAFVTQKDFSFMRGILMMAGFVALGIIVASVIFGFDLGIIFSAAMVLFASGSILYTTSNIIHHYRTDQHVAASLALFAGVATLFYYILRILISMASND